MNLNDDDQFCACGHTHGSHVAMPGYTGLVEPVPVCIECGPDFEDDVGPHIFEALCPIHALAPSVCGCTVAEQREAYP